MIRVSVRYHVEGDHLVVSRTPTWVAFLEWWLDQWSWFASRFVLVYRPWNWALVGLDKHHKELLRVPVDGCEASAAIWNDHELCWKDECPYKEVDLGPRR